MNYVVNISLIPDVSVCSILVALHCSPCLFPVAMALGSGVVMEMGVTVAGVLVVGVTGGAALRHVTCSRSYCGQTQCTPFSQMYNAPLHLNTQCTPYVVNVRRGVLK